VTDRELTAGGFTAKQSGCQINTLNGLEYNSVSLFLCSQNVINSSKKWTSSSFRFTLHTANSASHHFIWTIQHSVGNAHVYGCRPSFELAFTSRGPTDTREEDRNWFGLLTISHKWYSVLWLPPSHWISLLFLPTHSTATVRRPHFLFTTAHTFSESTTAKTTPRLVCTSSFYTGSWLVWVLTCLTCVGLDFCLTCWSWLVDLDLFDLWVLTCVWLVGLDLCGSWLVDLDLFD